MPARPARKCSIVGLGIETLGVSLTSEARYSKSASWIGLTWLTLPETTIFGGAKWTSLPAAFWNALAIPPCSSTPSSWSRKSVWKK